MKHLLFACLVIFLDLIGVGPSRCVREQHHSHHPTPGPPVNYLEVQPDTVILNGRKGANDTIFVNTYVHWDVVVKDSDQLAVNPPFGNGNEEIIVTAKSSNQSRDDHHCTLVIKTENRQRKVLVIQKSEWHHP